MLLRLVRDLHRMDILGLHFSFLILLTYLVEHHIWVVVHLFLLRLSPLILLDLLMWDKQQMATPILMRLHFK